MSVLEDYDKRCGREPLTEAEVLAHLEAAARYLERGYRTTSAETERVICWLGERLMSALDRIVKPPAPTLFRCGWCHLAGGQTEEAWHTLPSMSDAEVKAHTMVCEHNPMVRELNELRARVADLEGRVSRSAEDGDTLHLLREARGLVGDLDKALDETKASFDAVSEAAEVWSSLCVEANMLVDRVMADISADRMIGGRARIRGLLASDMTAGELRKALADLVG